MIYYVLPVISAGQARCLQARGSIGPAGVARVLADHRAARQRPSPHCAAARAREELLTRHLQAGDRTPRGNLI